MAVTVQMQFTSAVTEMYQDAFMGSSMENGTTMIICNYPGTPIVAKHGAFSL